MTTVIVLFYHAADPSNTFLFESQMSFVPRIGEHVSLPYTYPNGDFAHIDWEVTSVEWCLGEPEKHHSTPETYRGLYMVSICLKPLGFIDPSNNGLVPVDDLDEAERALLLPGGLS